MTEKLYYQNSHLFAFDAKVLDCRAEKKGYSVVLDRTAFFPEGGGQLADTGTLGGVRVTDVHEKGGEIRHYTDAPLNSRRDRTRRARHRAAPSPHAEPLGRAHPLRPCPQRLRL